jgi:hypothetical protein
MEVGLAMVARLADGIAVVSDIDERPVILCFVWRLKLGQTIQNRVDTREVNHSIQSGIAKLLSSTVFRLCNPIGGKQDALSAS